MSGMKNNVYPTY